MKRRCMHVGLGSLGSYSYKAIEETFSPKNSILIDPDVVAEHNIYNSAFLPGHIKQFKVSVLAWNKWDYVKIHKKFEDVILEKIFATISGSVDLSCDIIICAVDSMQTRKNIFEYFKTEEKTELFVDLRGSKDQVRVYVISRDDIKFYEDRFYPDSEVTVEGCEAVITSFNAKLCSILLLEELKKYFLKEKYRRELIYDTVSLNLLCENIKEPNDGTKSGTDRETSEGQIAEQLSGEENNSGSEERVGETV